MNTDPMSAPPAWRPPPGEVETHVPTMSTAERVFHAGKPRAVSAPIAPAATCTLPVITEQAVVDLIANSKKGRLTPLAMQRHFQARRRWYEDHPPPGTAYVLDADQVFEQVAEIITHLDGIGLITRGRGRGGPYHVTPKES